MKLSGQINEATGEVLESLVDMIKDLSELTEQGEIISLVKGSFIFTVFSLMKASRVSFAEKYSTILLN